MASLAEKIFGRTLKVEGHSCAGKHPRIQSRQALTDAINRLKAYKRIERVVTFDRKTPKLRREFGAFRATYRYQATDRKNNFVTPEEMKQILWEGVEKKS